MKLKLSREFNQFDAGCDLVVIDQNPELADIDNPRGDIHGFRAFVRASNEFGDTRFLYMGTFIVECTAMEKAEAMARAISNRVNILKRPPVNFDSWVPGRPIYGSEAYLEYGAANDLALEAMEG